MANVTQYMEPIIYLKHNKDINSLIKIQPTDYCNCSNINT